MGKTAFRRSTCAFPKYCGTGAAALLEEIQPKFVILYDADVAFVRAIEVAQASRRPLNICAASVCAGHCSPPTCYFLLMSAGQQRPSKSTF